VSDQTGTLSFGQFYFGTLLAIGSILLVLLSRPGPKAAS
jgi:hypothetical protein